MSEEVSKREEGVGTEAAPMKRTSRMLSRKVIAVVVVVILISASTFAVWYFYFRHWSARELADNMLIDEQVGGYTGFKSGLAGRSVIVEGKVTRIDMYETTLGTATVVELDRVAEASLVYWYGVSLDLGDKVERKVSFEWAYWNEDKHVYSPQVWLPLGYACAYAVVMNAVSHVNSNGGMISISNEGSDLRVEIQWLGEPAHLNTANCTLVYGTKSGILDYFFIWDGDARLHELDTIQDLTNGIGDNHTIEFSDENNDGYLDNGDEFVLKNLTRPDTECGIKTYMFHIEWPLGPDMDTDYSPIGLWCYIPVLKEGAAWPGLSQNLSQSFQTPVVRGFLESEGKNAQTLTIDSVSGTIPWSNFTIQLSDGTNFAQWEPMVINPLGESLGPRQLGSINIDANVTHMSDTGILSPGDRISVSAVAPGNFSPSTVYTLDLIYKGTNELTVRKSFCLNDTPVAHLLPYPSLGGGTINGTGFTFTPVHVGVNNTYRPFDLSWNNVIVNLTDGTNNVSWTLSSDSLNLDFGSGRSFGNLTLGPIDVLLYVWDLNGDGQVNHGDRLELRTLGSTGFGSATNYTVTAICIHTATDICSAAFTG